MKRIKLSPETYKMCSSRRKGAPGSRMKLSPVFKEIKRLKQSLVLNGIKGVVTSPLSVEDHTELSFQLVKQE